MSDQQNQEWKMRSAECKPVNVACDNGTIPGTNGAHSVVLIRQLLSIKRITKKRCLKSPGCVVVG